MTDFRIHKVPDGFSNTKGDPDYWLDAVRDFWAETELDTDDIELLWIVNWFDRRRNMMEHKGLTEKTPLLPERYRERASEIDAVVKIYNGDGKKIVEELKRRGIIAQSTYWADVTFFHRLPAYREIKRRAQARWFS